MSTSPATPKSESLALLERIAASAEAHTALLEQIAKALETMKELMWNQPVIRHAAGEPATSQPAATGASAGRTRETIRVVKIVKSVDEKTGEVKLRAAGGRFMQFGIPIYAEAFAACGIDADALRFGPNDFNRDMIVEFEANGDGQPKPKRVVGLAQ